MLAIAAQIGYIILHYRTVTFDFAWWFGIAATLAFSALMVFASRALAGLLRVALGLVFLIGAVQSAQSCADLAKFTQACTRMMSVLGPVAHRYAVLPAIQGTELGRIAAGGGLVLALLLIFGLWSRIACGIAALVLLYDCVLLTSGGLSALLQDATPLLCAGAFLLAANHPSFMGLDNLRRSRRSEDPFLLAFDEIHERSAHAWPGRRPAERPLARSPHVLQDDVGEAI